MRNQLLDEPCTECEALRHQLADERLCHAETREQLAAVEKALAVADEGRNYANELLSQKAQELVASQRVKELEEGAKFFHEIENLKEQLADERLCHEETREQVADLQTELAEAHEWSSECERVIEQANKNLAASEKHIVYSTQEWNDLKDELASALDDLDREVRVGNDYLQRIAELEAVIKSQSTKETLLDAHASMVEREDVPCNPHPDAPHGFDRNASHSAGYYICECHGWEPK